MNYYAARQRQSDQRFDFTCKNDSLIYPVGYCGGFAPPLSNDAYVNELLKLEQEKLAPHKHKFHTDGHGTKEEAAACYRKFLLDTRSRFTTQESSQRKCEAFTDASKEVKCGRWTQGLVFVDDWFACICEDHRKADIVAALFPEVGTITSS